MTYLFKSRNEATTFMIELINEGVDFLFKAGCTFEDDIVIITSEPTYFIKTVIETNISLGLMTRGTVV